MPNAMVSLDYHKCRPDQCNGGICLAVPACPLKLLKQEEVYGFPMVNPALCKGCAKCASACPLSAINIS